MSSRPKSPAVLFAAVVLLIGCGGSDSGGTDEAGGVDAAGSDGDEAALSDDPGADVLDSVGIDVDDLEATDADDADDAGELSGPADDGTLGRGAGTIFVDGAFWAFEADVCISQPDFLQVSGSGLRTDGVPFYGSIDVNQDADVDGDGTPDPSGSVTLEFGIDSGIGTAADDEPDWSSTILIVGEQIDIDEFEYEIDADGQISGSGIMTDSNGIAAPFGEYVDFEFSGGCL